MTLPQTEVAIRGKRLVSCQMGQTHVMRDVPRYVEMLEDGRLDAGPIITGIHPLAEINEANEVAAGRNALTGRHRALASSRAKTPRRPRRP